MLLSFARADGRLLLGLLVTTAAVSGLAACDHVPVPAKVMMVASATRNEPAAGLAPTDLTELRQAALSRADARGPPMSCAALGRCVGHRPSYHRSHQLQ